MPDIPSYDSIRNLLADGHTESAVNSLLQLAKSKEKEYFTSALLLKNRLETLQQNEIEGVLDQHDERLEWARISKGLMSLVEQMERRELPKRPEELLPQGIGELEKTDLASKLSRRLMKWLVPVVAVGLILLFLVPKIVENKPSNPTPQEAKLVEPQLQELPGQLIYFDESPVADAVISIKGLDQEYTARTDSKGIFTLKVKPDLIDKQVEFSVKVNGKDQTENIRLSPENIRKYTLTK